MKLKVRPFNHFYTVRC